MAVSKKARPATSKNNKQKTSVESTKSLSQKGNPASKVSSKKPVPVSSNKKVAETKPVKVAASLVKKPLAPSKTNSTNQKGSAAAKPALANKVTPSPGKTAGKGKPEVKTKPVEFPAKKAAASKTISSKPADTSVHSKNGKKVSGADLPKQAVKKEIPVKKQPASAAVKTPAKTAAPKNISPVKTPASKSAGGKSDLPAKTSSSKPVTSKVPGTVPAADPLDVKAKKVMKELEETMDMSKVKPRIVANPPAPKPVHRLVSKEPLKLVEPVHTIKEKFQLEFEFRSSPRILFNALSDSSGLAGWFADEVRTKDKLYTFVWEGGESYAKLVAIKEYQLVRFQWNEDVDGTYFQFEIKQDDITGEIALVVTDFANPGEKETNIRLWESQIQNLRMMVGSL